MKVVLITGTNSGFGLLTVLEFLKKGYRVIATMRDVKNKDELVEKVENSGFIDRLDILQLDVTKKEEIQSVKNELIKRYGKIDILINNAGYSQGGFVSDLTVEQWQNQFNVNVHGVLRVTKTMLPLLREAGKAHIVNISSVSGSLGFPGLSPYCASKFAIEGFSESLRLELLKENIYVSLVQPASYQTKIWEKGLASIQWKQLEEDELKQAVLSYAAESAKSKADPLEVARLITKICEKKRPGFRYPVGKGAKLLSLAKRCLPWRLLEKIIISRLLSGKNK
ncbi:NADP-dependent 3-hydroxy acid dehydrogenase YdfG [Gracilibacillus ureilyticus]|uniref:NADP-dependent 3-hydroxy acid dehydrogenase YdfG n=1 Tax=Gracilibacillus ureilyticus TaxID=531814 RepID=A0A1H9RD03_9BACI|nr:SDR family oxidoreductase [Gracilibacillus ureilyticus]SER70602.1 NADP-dependent 3-hydroxy acid dehydrogenase YdfG [Gracilibacillus ureilyticus]